MPVTTPALPLRRDLAPRRPQRTVPRRVWSVVSTVVLAAFALFAILAIGVPFVLGAQSYTVLTGSMNPGMPPGSLVAARPTDFASIRIGDVITYQLEPGEPAVVTHRVVGSTRDNTGDRMLITRGDANDVDDEKPVIAAQVRGVIVYAVPLLGYPNSLLPGTTRSAAVIGIGAAIVGYGVVVLASDLLRSHRRRLRARGAAVVIVIAMGTVAGAGITGASTAHADTLIAPTAAPSQWLQLSSDGRSWVTGGGLSVFNEAEDLVPGGPATESLWVRNAGPDAATAAIVIDFRPAGTSPADAALAEALVLRVDGEVVTPGEPSPLGRFDPSGARRVELRLSLAPYSGNASRNAAAVVAPVVRLTEIVGDEAQAAAPRPLAATGIDPAVGGTLIFSGLTALIAGAVLLRRSRHGSR